MSTRAPFYAETRGGGRDMRRTKEGIMMDILKVAIDPIGPTRLMYSTNLSWRPLREYITKLTSAGFLELRRAEKREIYTTTEAGKNLLRLGEQIQRELSKRIRA